MCQLHCSAWCKAGLDLSSRSEWSVSTHRLVACRLTASCSGFQFSPALVLQKINTKNVFGLHLIDYMTDILKQKDSELTNFKVSWS